MPSYLTWAGIVAVVGFASTAFLIVQTLLTIRKLNLEIARLKAESHKDSSRIALPTLKEVEAYGRRAKFSSQIQLPLLIMVMVAGWFTLSAGSALVRDLRTVAGSATQAEHQATMRADDAERRLDHLTGTMEPLIHELDQSIKLLNDADVRPERIVRVLTTCNEFVTEFDRLLVRREIDFVDRGRQDQFQRWTNMLREDLRQIGDPRVNNGQELRPALQRLKERLEGVRRALPEKSDAQKEAVESR